MKKGIPRDQIDPDVKKFTDELEKNGFDWEAYVNGSVNAEDINGITQTFYTTTGTILFHRSNDPKDHATHTIRNSNINTFMYFLNNPEKIQELFY